MAPKFRLHLPDAVEKINKLNDKDFEFFDYVLTQEYPRVFLTTFNNKWQFYLDLQNVQHIYQRARIDETEMYVAQFVKDFESGYYDGYGDYEMRDGSPIMNLEDDEDDDRFKTSRNLNLPNVESKLSDFNDYELDFFEFVLRKEFNNKSVEFFVDEQRNFTYKIFVDIKKINDSEKVNLNNIFKAYEESVERFTNRFLDGVYEDYRPDFDSGLAYHH